MEGLSSQYNIGDVIPDITVTDAENRPTTLTEQMGEHGVFIFVLRGTWCPFCVNQIHLNMRRYHRYVQRGIGSVFITPEDELSVQNFKQTVPRPLPFGLHADPQSSIVDALSPVTEIPSERPLAVYLVNRDRRVMWRYLGAESETYPSYETLLEIIGDHLVA